MNTLELFAGIGGLSLGLERAGMTVVGQVEINPFCRALLTKNWPEVPKHDDVRTTLEWWHSEPRPPVDVAAGGFPCQPVSGAGRKRARDDERWLWPAMAAIIRDLRPRYAILENVPGLLVRGMGDVLGDLADIGYDAEWGRVSAASVGAPHLRNRVFIVAYPAGNGRRPEALADPDILARPAPSAQRVFTGVAAPRRVDGTHGRTGAGRDHWATEPDVGRVADGVPSRMDRLRALGNAVVPEVGKRIGELVMRDAAARGGMDMSPDW